jgi:quinol monooxygenase YgiN
VVLRLKEENSATAREAFLAATGPLVQTVRQEEGCIHYSLLSSPNDRNMFAFVERWATNDALAAHSVAPHMEAIRPALRNFANVLSFKTCWDTVSAKVPNFKAPDVAALDGSTVRICNSFRVVDKTSFLRLARAMSEEFLNQDGCLEYSFAEVMGGRDEIMSTVLWRDQAALKDSHTASAKAGELLVEFQKFHTRLFSDAWVNGAH